MSVTGGVHFDLVKRVLRDIKRSGQAPEEIIQQVLLLRNHPPHCLCHGKWTLTGNALRALANEDARNCLTEFLISEGVS